MTILCQDPLMQDISLRIEVGLLFVVLLLYGPGRSFPVSLPNRVIRDSHLAELESV